MDISTLSCKDQDMEFKNTASYKPFYSVLDAIACVMKKRWMHCVYMHLFVFVYLCFYFLHLSFMLYTIMLHTQHAQADRWGKVRVSVWLPCLCAFPKYFDSSLPEYKPADAILWLIIQTWVPLVLKHIFSYVACFFYNIKKMFDLLTV